MLTLEKLQQAFGNKKSEEVRKKMEKKWKKKVQIVDEALFEKNFLWKCR